MTKSPTDIPFKKFRVPQLKTMTSLLHYFQKQRFYHKVKAVHQAMRVTQFMTMRLQMMMMRLKTYLTFHQKRAHHRNHHLTLQYLRQDTVEFSLKSVITFPCFYRMRKKTMTPCQLGKSSCGFHVFLVYLLYVETRAVVAQWTNKTSKHILKEDSSL